jgi:phytanoyl-CoA hydroxylase
MPGFAGSCTGILGAEPDGAEVAIFRRDGFIVMPASVSLEIVDDVRSGLEDAFEGRFDTGAYPDSCLWQKGTSIEDVPRQMVNAWKCSLRVSRLVLSASIARTASCLIGWKAARLAADSVWFKPPNWRAGGYHRDEMDVFTPSDLVTCWVALDDVRSDNGSLHYAVGSHLWESHAEDDLDVNIGDRPQRSIIDIAARQGIQASFESVVGPRGTLSFHHGRTWHGTTPNTTLDWRRALGIHLIRCDASFTSAQGGHVLGRYKTSGSSHLDDNFFPLLWSASGVRSQFLDAYCLTGRRG